MQSSSQQLEWLLNSLPDQWSIHGFVMSLMLQHQQLPLKPLEPWLDSPLAMSSNSSLAMWSTQPVDLTSCLLLAPLLEREPEQ